MKLQLSLQTETQLQYETSSYSCQYVNTDLYTREDNDYLHIADQFSKSLFVRCLHSNISTAVIKQLK